jgi:CRP/FNR family cyclic AMP-dependent transcriptional regulator
MGRRDSKFPKLAVRERLQMLKRVSWLSDSQRNTFAAEGLFVKYQGHEPIFLEGSSTDRVFFLLAGIAKIYYSHRKQHILVTHLVPGDTFGTGSLLPNSKHQYASEALSDCMVAAIEPDIFAPAVFGSSFDQLGPALANTMDRGFELVSRYTQFLPLNSRGKLALSLLEMARKFGIRDARGVLLMLPVSHTELGTMVGSSRQHVTMQLRAFERGGLIVREGRRLIIIPELLKTVLDE